MKLYREKVAAVISDTTQSMNSVNDTIRASGEIRDDLGNLPSGSVKSICDLYRPRNFDEASYIKHLTDSHQTVKKTGVWRSVATLLIAPWVWWSRLNG
jgi:hypothetical protein